jgi:hypothetical protein
LQLFRFRELARKVFSMHFHFPLRIGQDWWSDYLDMSRKAYAPPYICGKEISCAMG